MTRHRATWTSLGAAALCGQDRPAGSGPRDQDFPGLPSAVRPTGLRGGAAVRRGISGP